MELTARSGAQAGQLVGVCIDTELSVLHRMAQLGLPPTTQQPAPPAQERARMMHWPWVVIAVMLLGMLVVPLAVSFSDMPRSGSGGGGTPAPRHELAP